MGRLAGKVAVVTGAASGIGEGSALRLAAYGAAVCCADINGVGAALVAEKINEGGGRAIALEVDVADPDANLRMVTAATSAFGHLDIAHLNAGTGSGGPLLEMSLEAWNRTVAVNLTGTMLGLQAAARKMVEAGGGSIVITSSTAGLSGVANVADYVATKHGVIGLARTAALDLAKHNIRVNVLCPGITDTPLFGPLHETEQLAKVAAKMVPLGRPGLADEMARVVAFLASDDASYLTGAVVPVDGGMTVGGSASSLFGARGGTS